MLKKTLRSIRKFAKALTTSRRSRRNERRAKQQRKQSEEQAALIGESSEQSVTSSTRGGQQHAGSQREVSNGASIVFSQVEPSSVSTSPISVQQFLSLDLWDPEFTPISANGERMNLDPYIGQDPFSPANGDQVFTSATDPFATDPFAVDPFTELDPFNSEYEEFWAFFDDYTTATVVNESDTQTGSFLDGDDTAVVATNDPFGVQEPKESTGSLHEECNEEQNNSSMELPGPSSVLTAGKDFISESSPVDTFTSYAVPNEEDNEPVDNDDDMVAKHKIDELNNEECMTVQSQKIVFKSHKYVEATDAAVGYIAVSNVSSQRKVFARVTTNNWDTYTDMYATFLSSSNDQVDMFSLDFPSGEKVVEFALCMEVDGQNFWDNNNGNNYVVVYTSD